MSLEVELPALVRVLQERDEPEGLGDDLAAEMYEMAEAARAEGIREGKRIGWDSDAWSEMVEPVAAVNDEAHIDASTFKDADELHGTSTKDTGELPLVLTVVRAAKEMGVRPASPPFSTASAA